MNNALFSSEPTFNSSKSVSVLSSYRYSFYKVELSNSERCEEGLIFISADGVGRAAALQLSAAASNYVAAAACLPLTAAVAAVLERCGLLK